MPQALIKIPNDKIHMTCGKAIVVGFLSQLFPNFGPRTNRYNIKDYGEGSQDRSETIH